MKRVAIVMVKAARMPNSCWGQYVRVAAVEVDADALLAAGRAEPTMISNRARGVVRVLNTWERCYHGTTDRCESARAEAAAQEVCDERNAELGAEADIAAAMLFDADCRQRAADRIWYDLRRKRQRTLAAQVERATVLAVQQATPDEIAETLVALDEALAHGADPALAVYVKRAPLAVAACLRGEISVEAVSDGQWLAACLRGRSRSR